VSSNETFPGEAKMVAAAQNPTYVETGDTEEELLAKLPPAPDDVNDMLVVTSQRIPLGLHRRLKDPDRRGIDQSPSHPYGRNPANVSGHRTSYRECRARRAGAPSAPRPCPRRCSTPGPSAGRNDPG
jgi:hypothetical protein